MRKPQEDPADRIWREKLDACISGPEAIVLLVLLVAMAAGALVGS